MSLIGEKIFDQPVELHDQQLRQLENRFLDCFQEQETASKLEEIVKNKRVLPVKALNEVSSLKKILSYLILYLIICLFI